MALRADLEECCSFIEQGRVTERKKYCEKLSNLLDNQEAIEIINDKISWKRIISALQECLKKDAEKIQEDIKKKGSSSCKYSSPELLQQVIKLGIIQDIDGVDIPTLIGYIIGCMRDQMMKSSFYSMYINILIECILSQPTSRGKVTSDNWCALLELIIKLLGGRPTDTLLYRCLMLTMKYGPLSGLAASVLREQFEYITKLCQEISLSFPLPQQEYMLEIALDLCKHTAKDNRILCCKLGEDVFSNFVDLYEQNGRESKTKEQLVEFFRLQLTIHQPDGVSEGHPGAYAKNWSIWTGCLRMIYTRLYKELKFYFQSRQKNNSFFINQGEKISLCPEFSALFVEVSYQIFQTPEVDITLSLDCTMSVPTTAKRQKLEITLQSYIAYINETKSWLWIHIVCELIKRYPQIITIEDYIELLRILSTIQIESSDSNTVCYTYSCLLVMFDLQKNIEYLQQQTDIEKLWKSIAMSTTKAFGLNQHKDETELLLVKLIKADIVEPECILEPYATGLLNVSTNSIKVLETALQFTNFAKSRKMKTDLMNAILNPSNVKDFKFLLDKATAVFLINLTLRSWQIGIQEDNSCELNSDSDKFSDVKVIYKQVLYEKNVVEFENTKKEIPENTTYDFDDEMANTLYIILKQFVRMIPSNVDALLSVVVLITNMTDCLIFYKNLEEHNLRNSPFVKMIEKIFSIDSLKSLPMYDRKDDRRNRKMLEDIKILDIFFSLDINQLVMEQVKDLVPFNLLKSIVMILNELQNVEDYQVSSLRFEIKKAIVKALSNFCCFSRGNLNQNQQNILEVISAPTFNCQLDGDYMLLVSFLETLKFSKVGIMSDSILRNILISIKEMCIHRYEYVDNAIEVLNIMKDLYPHIALSKNSDIKSDSVNLLQPFYDNRINYGPGLSVALLDCIKQLCHVDPEIEFSHWSGNELINIVPNFLCSDYQVVRFKAIETLVVFYQVNSQSNQLQSFHRQEVIFTRIYDKSLEVFTVAGRLSEERKIDEVISRTASVLHTFAALIIHCNAWVEECLFALLKLAFKKKIDSVDRILTIINKNLMQQSETNILDKYIEHLLEKWLIEGLNIDDFVFKLFKCHSKAEFYSRYFENCVPYLMVVDRNDLIVAAKHLGYSEKDIVQKTCTKIFGQTVCKHSGDILNEKLIEKNNILAYYTHIIGLAELKRILTENLEKILLVILENMTDEIYIKDNFDVNVIFLTKSLSVQQVKKCFLFVQTYLCNGMEVATYLAELHIGKLEMILLSLKVNVYSAFTTDDRIKAMHRYVYFLYMITDSLSTESCWQHFFIRDTMYSIINMIKNNTKSTEFLTSACRFLKIFIRKILPKFAKTFDKCLNYTVNSLKSFALNNQSIRLICLDILDFLIVQCTCHLIDGIEKLDTFPSDPDFSKIRTIHHNIKYGTGNVTLRQEVAFFLEHDAGDFTTRIDSLVHLREVLSSKKAQLQVMYKKLLDMRGFSEDSQRSPIHRLICTLAKLSCSKDEKVSFEAIRCLGELGPANLVTLVLEPEEKISEDNYVPFELLTGHVIWLLSQYIVDEDIRVVEAASKSFYAVLNCKEGQKIGGSDLDFGDGTIEKIYIMPYFPYGKATTSKIALNTEAFINNLTDNELWCPEGEISHESWIIKLVSKILETFTHDSYISKLIPICQVKPQFCEKLLPLLINLLLFLSYKDIVALITQNIDHFFAMHWNNTVPKFNHIRSVTVDKKSVKCMLDVIRLVRLQREFNKSKTRFVGELKVNYLKVAKAAEFCSAHFTALLYSDLWCQDKIEELQNRNVSYAEKRSTMLDIIYENEGEEGGEALQNILRTAYKAVGDYDALSGCGISFLLKPQFRVEHYKELGKWDEAMFFYAMQASHDPHTNFSNLMDSFKMCSLYQVPLFCHTEQTAEPPYECLWRLSQWNVGEKQKSSPKPINNTKQDFEKFRFHALKAIHDKNQYAFEDFKKMQSRCVIEDLRHTSLESSQNLYPILTRLQSIVEMDDFADSFTAKNIGRILGKWEQQLTLISKNDFRYMEPIVAQRITMLGDYLKTHTNDDHHDDLKNYLVEMTLNFAGLAKEEGFLKKGQILLENLKHMNGLSDDVNVRIQIMDAQLSWAVNNTVVARHILNQLCKNENINQKLRATALKLSGQYMSETYSENRSTIIHNYFIESLSIMKKFNRNDEDYINILDTYDRLAQYADREYQQIKTYMKSDLFQRKIVNMEKAKKAAASIQNQMRKTYDERKAAALQNRESNIDETEINNTKNDSNQLLVIALKFYLLNLLHCDTNNNRIFRIMSLFLENRTNQDITPIIDQYLPQIPSYKYILMLPQLVPHITDAASSSSNTDAFSQKVNEIVENCAVDHPHHTLPLLLSLSNANKDRDFSEQKTKASPVDARTLTAKKILAKLSRIDGMTEHISKLQQLSVALIELAYYKETTERKKESSIPRTQKITKIKNFDNVLLPTIDLKVRPDKVYSNIVGITSFDNVYHRVGGINAPKRIICRGTDGISRSQLVKGCDDLRQDAVMEQVFTIMNSLLAKNKHTRNLLIRTYKIVPLSMRSGILQWVDNSMPLGMFLLGEDGKSGAHVQFRPKDKSPNVCRDMFRNAPKSPEEKLKVYKNICHNLKPVLHKFFENSFPQPTIWYERRRAYIYSVATTSMCGYILGIGDRHLSNILIDKTTAEVIHIDFGIAFEQGKVLPTPETVPFRLTRDIVDGMGVSGVEGLFRRSCEKTMEVLRQNAQTITTILEVLLYDPLYVWTVTAAEANKRQTEEDISESSLDNSDEERTVNITAERALLRLREKLQGTELGHPASIEHQVGTLIQQAIDPVNLCKLYFGWQPYM